VSGLSSELFREVQPDFFRVLAGPSARLYVDVLDALEIECSERQEGISREEALGIAADVLEKHPDWRIDADEPAQTAAPAELPVREKARFVIDRLITARWLEEPARADYQRIIFFDANGAVLLEALRKIARPEASVFSDSLSGVCAILANSAALAEQPWPQVEACAGGMKKGVSELRSMQKSVERFTRRQLETRTLGENLRVIFDEYSEQMGKTCYAELVRSRLPSRLNEARERIDDLLLDSDLLARMQAEVLRRDSSLPAATAMARVRNELEELMHSIEMVSPLAEMIDRRTAEFTRRSLARFRYLQEVVGERRSQVKQLFEIMNSRLAGKRLGLADLESDAGLPPLLVTEFKHLAGRDSLYEPARRRVVEVNEPIEDEVSDELRERTRRQMEAALRDSLTVVRANRFVAGLPGGKGSRIPSDELPLRNEDDLADVIAILLHCESNEARYRVEVPHAAEDALQGRRSRHGVLEFDEFFVIKK
jgi:hypothetical protein